MAARGTPHSPMESRVSPTGPPPARPALRLFTEVFDTRDLKDAKALLEELAA